MASAPPVCRDADGDGHQDSGCGGDALEVWGDGIDQGYNGVDLPCGAPHSALTCNGPGTCFQCHG